MAMLSKMLAHRRPLSLHQTPVHMYSNLFIKSQLSMRAVPGKPSPSKERYKKEGMVFLINIFSLQTTKEGHTRVPANAHAAERPQEGDQEQADIRIIDTVIRVCYDLQCSYASHTAPLPDDME